MTLAVCFLWCTLCDDLLMPSSGQALALVLGTIPRNHFSSQWIHRIFVPSSRPRRAWTRRLKQTCFSWFSGLRPGLMFFAYSEYVSWECSHFAMHVCWHQLLMCRANCRYETQLYDIIPCTNSSSMNGCLASCWRSWRSNSATSSSMVLLSPDFNSSYIEFQNET